MYYKDMSNTPLEEDFDIQQDDFSEKAKIIDEETWKVAKHVKTPKIIKIRAYTFKTSIWGLFKNFLYFKRFFLINDNF